MIRNIRGMILTAPSGSEWVQAGRPHNSRDRVGGLRSRERARWEEPSRVVTVAHGQTVKVRAGGRISRWQTNGAMENSDWSSQVTANWIQLIVK
jgi:hypothetical protein